MDATSNGYSTDAYPMVIMLTDGQPTMGVTNLDQIRSNIRQKIQGDISLFTLGFGDDVDGRFLEQMALENQVSRTNLSQVIPR